MKGYYVAALAKCNDPANTWDVSRVTSFNGIWKDRKTFNEVLSSWDVSNAVTLIEMFSGAEAFDQDISAWQVSKVTKFTSMFFGATAFDQDVSAWQISSVAVGSVSNHAQGDWSDHGFNGMFDGASSFKHDPSPACPSTQQRKRRARLLLLHNIYI